MIVYQLEQNQAIPHFCSVDKSHSTRTVNSSGRTKLVLGLGRLKLKEDQGTKGKDYLPKLLIKIRSPCQSGGVTLSMVHVKIIVNELCALDEFDHLATKGNISSNSPNIG